MAAAAVTAGDLARDPADVVVRLLAWDRGERGVAVRETLDASARDLFRRSYTLWVWTGQSADRAAVWALPVPTATAEEFRPARPAVALARCIAAAVGAGARAEDLMLRDWQGLAYLEAPGLDVELSAIALGERHPEGSRVRVAPLPPGVVPKGPPISLPAPSATQEEDGLLGLAAATGVHPLTVALTLAEHGQSIEDPPRSLVSLLREWGCDGEPVLLAPEEPSFDIADDPCPRRRHARKVLQRLLRMGKVGHAYHTEFDHMYRGAAPDERAEALAVGEALVRAGLLGEKPSVGQRHVYLRREALPEIHALIDRGETASAPLAEAWTAPPPAEGR